MTIDDYLDLPYTLTLRPDQDDKGNKGFVATVAELPGAVAQGTTEAETLENLRESMRSWLDAALHSDAPIPLPEEEPTHSGRLLLRMPVTLHADLARCAEAEGTSLNKFVVAALAGAIGWRASAPREDLPAMAFQLGYRPARRWAQHGFVIDRGPFVNELTVETPINAQSITRLNQAGVQTIGDLLQISFNHSHLRFTVGDE